MGASSLTDLHADQLLLIAESLGAKPDQLCTLKHKKYHAFFAATCKDVHRLYTQRFLPKHWPPAASINQAGTLPGQCFFLAMRAHDIVYLDKRGKMNFLTLGDAQRTATSHLQVQMLDTVQAEALASYDTPYRNDANFGQRTARMYCTLPTCEITHQGSLNTGGENLRDVATGPVAERNRSSGQARSPVRSSGHHDGRHGDEEGEIEDVDDGNLLAISQLDEREAEGEREREVRDATVLEEDGVIEGDGGLPPQ